MLALAFCLFLAGSANAQPPVISLEVGLSSSCDRADYTAPENKKPQPAPANNGSSDSTTDLDDNDGSSDDVSADTTTRHDPPPSSFFLHKSAFSLTRSAGNVPAFLFPAHFSDFLHEHIRERAPPGLT
jgi:hypothetical protein